MWWLFHVCVVAALAVVQLSFIPTLFGRWPIPNLVFAVVMLALIERRWLFGLLAAGLGGLFLDLAAPGRSTLTLALLFFWAVDYWLLAPLFPHPSLVFRIGFAAAATLLLVTPEWLLGHGGGGLAFGLALFMQLATIAVVATVWKIGERSLPSRRSLGTTERLSSL